VLRNSAVHTIAIVVDKIAQSRRGKRIQKLRIITTMVATA
jgi:hypothetical protein